MIEASKRLSPLTLATALLAVSSTWPAASEEATDAARELTERLEALTAGIVVKSVKPSLVAGLYEVKAEGGTLYVTEDVGYILAGSLYEVRDGGLVNLTEAARVEERRELLARLDEADLITFTPDAGAKASVLVFTDTDCGFCRQLHRNMSGYLEHGIEVRYLAFPRAGVGSRTYDKMVSAWCAEDSRGALTALKRGEGIPDEYCDNHPIGEQYELGQTVGVAGTPSIILPNGRMLPGYVSPDDLAAMLGL